MTRCDPPHAVPTVDIEEFQRFDIFFFREFDFADFLLRIGNQKYVFFVFNLRGLEH